MAVCNESVQHKVKSLKSVIRHAHSAVRSEPSVAKSLECIVKSYYYKVKKSVWLLVRTFLFVEKCVKSLVGSFYIEVKMV